MAWRGGVDRVMAGQVALSDGFEWGGKQVRRLAALLALLALVLSVLGPVASSSPSAGAGHLVTVIVRAVPGATEAAAADVAALGGRVVRRIAVIDGFVARVPQRSIGALERQPALRGVTPNAAIQLRGKNKQSIPAG